jgi:uncharacterized protein YqkB
MGKIESNVKQIAYSQESVYNKLSDFNNIGKVMDRIPADQVKDLQFDMDTVSFSVSPVGTVLLRIIDREPFKCIKIASEKTPVALKAWIQIVPVDDSSCKIKLTVEADVNPFLAKMVEKPLKEGMEKAVDMLASIQYD